MENGHAQRRGSQHSLLRVMLSVFLTSCSLGLACFNSGRVNHPLAVGKCETLAYPRHFTACFSAYLSNILVDKSCRIQLFKVS